MKYAEIDKVNSEINMLDLKGKNYAMVPERVTAFRKLFPDGFITTDIINLSDDGTVVIMKAEAGYYREDGSRVVLGSGLAKEVQGKGMVNGTSHIENCETSAVGRALGMIGLGLNGGGICSAEELVNAITAQNQMKKDIELQKTPNDFKAPEAAKAAVEQGSTVPAPASSPVLDFLKKQMKNLQDIRKITAAENKELFKNQYQALRHVGLVPDKKLEEYTMEEAENLIRLMYERFEPKGTEIKQ